MWLRFAWTRDTKLKVTAVSALWFALLAWRYEASMGKAQQTAVVPAPRTATTSTTVAVAPTPMPALETGPAMIARFPLLLVPLDLRGFVLVSAAESKQCCGFVAIYAGQQTAQGLQVEMHVDNLGVPLDPADANNVVVTIEGHPGRAMDDAKLKDAGAQWTDGAWGGSVDVSYAHGGGHASAAKAAKDLAQQTAKLLDSYLTGTPLWGNRSVTSTSRRSRRRMPTAPRSNGRIEFRAS